MVADKLDSCGVQGYVLDLEDPQSILHFGYFKTREEKAPQQAAHLERRRNQVTLTSDLCYICSGCCLSCCQGMTISDNSAATAPMPANRNKTVDSVI